MNRWPASAGSAASSLRPPCLCRAPARTGALPGAVCRRQQPWGGPSPGLTPRSRGAPCRPPTRSIMPLLDFFWACFKRAKVRDCLFNSACPSDTLPISGEAVGRDGGGGVFSRAGACSWCLTSALEGCHARAPHACERSIVKGLHAGVLVSNSQVPMSHSQGRQGAVLGCTQAAWA